MLLLPGGVSVIKLHRNTKKILKSAYRYAAEFGHGFVGSPHLLLALAGEDSAVSLCLAGRGFGYSRLRQLLIQRIGIGIPMRRSALGLNADADKVIQRASSEAEKSGNEQILPEHLLIALLRTDCDAARLVGSESESICAQMLGTLGTPAPTPRRRAETRTLDSYSRDLCELAAKGALTPVFGREAEMQRVLQILCRRSKNNPLLLGEPGVGKTALAEALAQRIMAGSVPDCLAGKRVVALDMSSVVAGTKYRGDFEERLRSVLDEIRAAGNIILFVDEVHTLVGAGASEGAIDASNILKPALSRGELRLVAATTQEEYRRYICSDMALERRFQTVRLKEPSAEEAERILFGLRQTYEQYHGVRISDAAISAAVTLSIRYMPERRLPDKAIDLLDETAAGIQAGFSVQGNELTEADIVGTLSRSTGIPVLTDASAAAELLRLEERINRKIVGQSAVVSAVSSAIRRSRAGLRSARRPLASFLFSGPTGVGKTELCRVLCACLFGSESAMLKLDMSEYTELHSVSRLIGSPPGYIGHEKGGQLTEFIRRNPYALILFDELEKAHPDVNSILLQLLEDGVLTDANGNRADFTNAVIVMTTNFCPNSGGSLGFAPSESYDKTIAALSSRFLPELLNRIDDILTFSSLSAEQLSELASRLLDELCSRLAEQGITLLADEGIPALLARRAYDSRYGARPLRRLFQRKIESPIADMLLSGTLHKGAALRIVMTSDADFSLIPTEASVLCSSLSS